MVFFAAVSALARTTPLFILGHGIAVVTPAGVPDSPRLHIPCCGDYFLLIDGQNAPRLKVTMSTAL